ncbi:MAG: [FeFe] hydrogenase H-cluster maturation GTPase HydF [Clostridia bacterium]|nr:[FeFe] hydrogenase H-cluster maturation GTPase HydF [Clostridia bacterium]
MGLNDTPSANRVHIGFFGRRNAGKSSVVNAVTNQEISVVSDVLGTTTDPVQKAMEILPIGPVVIIDTPGIDDEGELGELRVKRTKQVLNKTDVAVLVVDGTEGKKQCDEELISIFKEKNIDYIVVYNKSDLHEVKTTKKNEICVSAANKTNINELKEKIAEFAEKENPDVKIIGDLIEKDDVVIMVTPIDSAAPKGRMILPQMQTLRDILDADGCAVVVKETELKSALQNQKKKPKLVVCDSQVFEFVDKQVPQDIDLTSFSILFARFKGNLKTVVEGAKAIETLKPGDTILISEGCTHHRQCDDIGTVKMPRWIREYTGIDDLNFEFTSGQGFTENFDKYKMIVHCGGCMLNEREMKYRQRTAVAHNTPITNYGIMIAYMKGILKRSVKMFPEINSLL